jgi:hypothetical protein
MTNFSKAFVVLVFAFYGKSLAMLSHAVHPFFFEAKTVKTSDVPAYIDRNFANQLTTRPSQYTTRGKEVEVGDIIQLTTLRIR